jgi:hypothetical protein
MMQDTKIFKRMMALLTKAKLQGRRHAIVWEFSGGRTESSKELTNGEMTAVIDALEKGFKELDRADAMRKKIISMAHELGWHHVDGIKPSGEIKYKADMVKINDWCCSKYSLYKKPLNDHTYPELVKLVTQFSTYHVKFIKEL